jgi:hypothetical protein
MSTKTIDLDAIDNDEELTGIMHQILTNPTKFLGNRENETNVLKVLRAFYRTNKAFSLNKKKDLKLPDKYQTESIISQLKSIYRDSKFGYLGDGEEIFDLLNKHLKKQKTPSPSPPMNTRSRRQTTRFQDVSDLDLDRDFDNLYTIDEDEFTRSRRTGFDTRKTYQTQQTRKTANPMKSVYHSIRRPMNSNDDITAGYMLDTFEQGKDKFITLFPLLFNQFENSDNEQHSKMIKKLIINSKLYKELQEELNIFQDQNGVKQLISKARADARAEAEEECGKQFEEFEKKGNDKINRALEKNEKLAQENDDLKNKITILKEKEQELISLKSKYDTYNEAVKDFDKKKKEESEKNEADMKTYRDGLNQQMEEYKIKKRAECDEEKKKQHEEWEKAYNHKKSDIKKLEEDNNRLREEYKKLEKKLEDKIEEFAKMYENKKKEKDRECDDRVKRSTDEIESKWKQRLSEDLSKKTAHIENLEDLLKRAIEDLADMDDELQGFEDDMNELIDEKEEMEDEMEDYEELKKKMEEYDELKKKMKEAAKINEEYEKEIEEKTKELERLDMGIEAQGREINRIAELVSQKDDQLFRCHKDLKGLHYRQNNNGFVKKLQYEMNQRENEWRAEKRNIIEQFKRKEDELRNQYQINLSQSVKNSDGKQAIEELKRSYEQKIRQLERERENCLQSKRKTRPHHNTRRSIFIPPNSDSKCLQNVRYCFKQFVQNPSSFTFKKLRDLLIFAVYKRLPKDDGLDENEERTRLLKKMKNFNHKNTFLKRLIKVLQLDKHGLQKIIKFLESEKR